MNSDAFCKLDSDLIISYNGSLLESVPKKRSSIIGTVLTKNGQLVSRNKHRAHWEVLSTPSVYLFYDNDTNVTFLIDTCKRLIKKIQPKGRIFDCTDRVIYEIKCGNWVPICDLSDKIQKTIILCNTVPAMATTATFQFMGENPVVEPFSEISADQVVFNDHTATVTFNTTGPGSLPPGGCAILAFSVCIDHKTVTIFKIFIRQTSAQHFAVQTATFGTPGTVNMNVPIQTCALPAFPTADTSSLGPTVVPINWTNLRYDHPVPSFNPATGIFTTPVAGDYEIDAVLTYNNNVMNGAISGATTLLPMYPHFYLPRFVLVQNRTASSSGTIIFDAPVDASIGLVNTAATSGPNPPPPDTTMIGPVKSDVPCGTTGTSGIAVQYHLADQGQAVINIGCTLNAGDTLQILYIDDINCNGGTTTSSTFGGFYTLDCLGTTFKATQIL